MRSLKRVPAIDWGKTALLVLTYLLVVLWTTNAWLLLLLPVVFDVYSTQVIPWGFWKKRKDGRKPSAVVEWLDAIIFALVAVYLLNIFLFQNYKIPTSSLEKSLLVGDHLCVSKYNYGPRMPNTPLGLPLVQNTLPFTTATPSYLEWPMWEYHRLAGTDSVRRGDIVVFNFPAGDTVCVNMTNPDYYSIVLIRGFNLVAQDAKAQEELRAMPTAWERNHYVMERGRSSIRQPSSPLSHVVSRPVDRRDCYVKRCVGMPGDTLSVVHNAVYINGVLEEDYPDVQHNYYVTTKGQMLNERFFENLGISGEDRRAAGLGPTYVIPLTKEKAEAVAQMPTVKSIVQDEDAPDSLGLSVFPYSPDYPWSRDNFGPLWIPRRGARLRLTPQNALLYERVITAYEGHSLDVADGRVFVDGVEAETYTFAMDYFFMMGDNRHKSADSRYWGFVPEDHVIGRPLFVWLSLDPDRSFPANIRWERCFKTDFDRR